MFQLAVYGKGGIGKSTMSANISYSLARRGHRVMQIGCDPKHDSTRLLIGGGTQRTVLDYVRQVPEPQRKLSDVAVEGSGGVICIESGGPEPGIGCAGRGILTAFDTVKRLGADSMGADIRLYDVLGDVVCGGFAVPLREENADGVIIVTSGEFMSLYAANNIMKGIRRFTSGRPRLIGLVLNSRGVEGEEDAVHRFAEATGTRIIAVVPRDRLFASAEAAGHTVSELYPDSEPAEAISGVVDRVEAVMAGADMDNATPLDDDQMSDLAAGREIRRSSRGASGPPVCDGCVMAPPRMRPRYSCSTCGAMIALARLADTAVIIHGPRSCAYLMDSAYLSTVADLYHEGIYKHPMPDNIYSTCMDEGAAIFGGVERLEMTLGDASEDGFSRMVVLTTCVSGMIGDDCDAVARDFMSSNPGTEVKVLHLDGIIGGDYFDGVEGVVTCLIGMMDPAVRTVPGTVNLVGTTFFDLQTPEAIRELDRMLSLFGLEVNCRFLDETTLQSIEGYCRGSMDIALNETGAEETISRIDEGKGRTAPMIRIPTGPNEYRGWLARMGEITGKSEIAEEESRRSDFQYRAFLDEMRPLLQGRRTILSTCITRSVDWFMDMAEDLGMEIVRLGYMKGEYELGNITRTRRDMVQYFYGKDSMSRDIGDLEPDILVYDVDRPDDCSVPAVHMGRIGPGLSSAFAFFHTIAEALGVGR